MRVMSRTICTNVDVDFSSPCPLCGVPSQQKKEHCAPNLNLVDVSINAGKKEAAA